MMPETPQQLLMLLFAVASLVTLGWHYWRSHYYRMPPSARNDIKARRLWRGDRQAYERKFGDIDRQLEAKQHESQE